MAFAKLETNKRVAYSGQEGITVVSWAATNSRVRLSEAEVVEVGRYYAQNVLACTRLVRH